MSLTTDRLGVRIGDRWLLRDATLRLSPGRLCVVLGGNGAGKTTLLRALAGDVTADEGEVSLDGQPLQSWSARALARRRAVLTQHDDLRFPFTVAEMIGLGRLPWTGSTTVESDQFVSAALSATGALEFRDRIYTDLSGGERGRVRLARALAQVWDQAGAFLLLDEPTAHFDFVYQHQCMILARQQARAGLGVVVVLHDPNITARYADDVAMISNGCLLDFGPAERVLTTDHLSDLYGAPVERFADGSGHPFFRVRD